MRSRLRLQHPLPAIDEVLSRQRLAIRPLQALTKVERKDRRIIVCLEILSQVRHNLVVSWINIHQTLPEIAELRQTIPIRDTRIEPDRFRAGEPHNLLFGEFFGAFSVRSCWCRFLCLSFLGFSLFRFGLVACGLSRRVGLLCLFRGSFLSLVHSLSGVACCLGLFRTSVIIIIVIVATARRQQHTARQPADAQHYTPAQ